MQVRFIVAYIINIQLRITKIGVSENRGPESTTLNRRILIIRTLKYDTLIFGNSHIVVYVYYYALRYKINSRLLEAWSHRSTRPCRTLQKALEAI